MSKWYYYNENGEKIGPIKGGELKQLALQGVVTRETWIENEAGMSLLAGKAEKLTFSETAKFKRTPKRTGLSLDEIYVGKLQPDDTDETNPFAAGPPLADTSFTTTPSVRVDQFAAFMSRTNQPVPQRVPVPVPVPAAKGSMSSWLVAIVGIVVVLAVGGTIVYLFLNSPPPLEPAPQPPPPFLPQPEPEPEPQPPPVPEPEPEPEPRPTRPEIIAMLENAVDLRSEIRESRFDHTNDWSGVPEGLRDFVQFGNAKLKESLEVEKKLSQDPFNQGAKRRLKGIEEVIKERQEAIAKKVYFCNISAIWSVL